AADAQNAAPSYARRPIPAVKTAVPPIIDGDLTDPCWKSAPKAETFVDRPRSVRAPDQTTAWIVYDEKAIYVAFYCKDSQPDQIVGRETIRDSGSGNEDSVTLTLDPFFTPGGGGGGGGQFSVNPLGTPSAHLSGGRGDKLEWKGNWTAAARRVSDGWTAEM